MSFVLEGRFPAAPCSGAMRCEPSSAPLDRRKTILIAALLAALTFAVFSPAVGYGFLNFDDGAYVYENPQVLKGLSGPGLQYAFTTRDIGTWAPLTWISYELDTTISGFRARSYHTTNILLHALAGALLFAVLQRMRLSLWASITVAVIFLVHPLRSESVAWIAERKDVLCAFFWMVGLLAYTFYAQKPTGGRWALVFLSFVGGLMSKMMMVTFPFVLLLLDFWPMHRTFFAEAGARRRMAFLILEKTPFLLAGLVVTFVTNAALRDRGALNPAGAGSAEFLRVPENYIFYVQKIFWPARLSILYPLEEIEGRTVALCALLLAAVTFLAVWQIRKMPSFLVGWLWFLGTLVPVIGFVPFGDFNVADRYSYIPSIGLLLASVGAVENLLGRFQVARWLGSGAIALACGVATVMDLPRWHDSITLYNAALRVGPHYVAYNNRGTALFRAGQLEPALKDFDRAVRLKPVFAQARNNRGAVLSDLGRYEEAIREFNKAIEQDPSFAAAYDNRGNAYLRLGKGEEALREYDHSIKLQPTVAVYYNNRAAAYFELRRYTEATADIERCRHLGGEPHSGLVQALAEATKTKL
jgi:protein O-mannosyl-transferase